MRERSLLIYIIHFHSDLPSRQRMQILTESKSLHIYKPELRTHSGKIPGGGAPAKEDTRAGGWPPEGCGAAPSLECCGMQ